MRRFLIALACTSLPTAALAHSPMTSSTPADGAVLATAPEKVEMGFGDPVRLTKVTLTPEGAAAVELDLSAAKAFADSFSLPVDAALSGAVELEWRAIAPDGHAMKGVISFTVD